MAKKKFSLDYILNKLEECEKRLYSVDNNLRYIKALQCFKLWLDRLDALYQSSVYHTAYFTTGVGYSTYERVLNSIQAYRYGERPF